MTAKTELPPTPSGNVANLISAQAAEIEALRAEVERLRTDLMESDEIREKLRHLLTRTAAALKGEPPAGVWHSWHDLPEKVAQLADALEALKAEAAGFKVDAERYRWVRAEAYLCPDSVEHGKIAYTIEVPTGVGCAEHTFNGAALPSLDEAIDAQIAASREQAK
jgi:hypothetical protein